MGDFSGKTPISENLANYAVIFIRLT